MGRFLSPSPFISERRAESDMPTAIEHIVSVFVALANRRQLEDMKLQRERAVLELQSQSGVSVSDRNSGKLEHVHS